MTTPKKPFSAALSLTALEDRLTPSGTSTDPYTPPPPPLPSTPPVIKPILQPSSEPPTQSELM